MISLLTWRIKPESCIGKPKMLHKLPSILLAVLGSGVLPKVGSPCAEVGAPRQSVKEPL